MAKKFFSRLLLLTPLLSLHVCVHAQTITAAGQPAQLDVRKAGENSIRITLKPVSYQQPFPFSPAVVERDYGSPSISIRDLSKAVKRKVGNLNVEVQKDPMRVIVTNAKNQPVQELTFDGDGNLLFSTYGQPVLGLGEGGPKPERGSNWRAAPIQFDRRGMLDSMQPRWQSDAYGSRNPVAMLVGTSGWGVFVASPWVLVDLQDAEKGKFIPWKPIGVTNTPQTQRNQGLNQGKGLPPIDKIVPGLFDVFVFDSHEPLQFMKDFSVITGPAAMPPKWALGYMQSHRTLIDENQMIGIVDTFRNKKIPVDAVIYLGTGFAPVGWNKMQPSFDFHPDVFKRDPKAFMDDMHKRNVKVVLHMVPWDRDKLPTLQGTIPPKPGEVVDQTHIKNYWQQHQPLIDKGVDAFWPDEGDWFNLHERIKRHQLYYQGHLSSQPNVRPWSLQRNGYPGIAQWGGWVWSGDTESSWKTLEGQVAVGINYSLSIGPYWGSDIGGFYSNAELTGELYARWYQFAAFCGSFRSHGRTWRTRLPWGWGLSYMGPSEDRVPPLESELNNPAIEPIARKYDELHYQLLPYTYTLAWEARNTGLPLMRAMWLHYPNDEKVRNLGTQYLWGRDLIVAPVFEKGASNRDVYLPQGDWYDWWTNTKESGGKSVSKKVDLATMPIYVRAGAIIPFDPVRQHVNEVVDQPTTLRIYQGANGNYTLYEDDGISQDYLKNIATITNITWNDAGKQLVIKPAGNGKMSTGDRKFKVELIPSGITKEVNYNGKSMNVQL
ncbi:glycoside hydrolase family 31 protein [Segetibacter sp. 3557_3]|uniref:glycoside hydrolase family 31 protein n=1 Tax=Segetibacter sp. 3557_3 TaxID=2547429 RepID=UPI00105887AF|nr:TIM-barrel domain-containing protein [Segetibacter sp. 3557_3]TDH27284.1 glycoside hydrolase family 31 protein [Segetibacter sp. 3557_3]